MRLFYIFLSLLLFSCTVTPPKKPVAKKPHPDLKKDTVEAPIHTQTFINYSFVEDSLSGKTSQMKFDELTLTYDAEGYQIESFYKNNYLQEQSFWYYDKDHRVIAEDYICKTLSDNCFNRKLTNHTYDTLGYEINRFSYEFLDTLALFSKYEIDYDKQGYLSNIIQYQFQKKKWQPFTKEVYKYNAKGQEQEKETYYHYMSLWLLKEKESYKYKDSIVEEKFAYNYKQSNAPRRIRYAYEGAQEQLTYISEKDSIRATETYLYDHRGAISKYTIYDAYGVEQERKFYLYTPYDKRLQEVVYKGDMEQERTIYQYDTKGLLTQKVTYVQGKIRYLTQVKYSYHLWKYSL